MLFGKNRDSEIGLWLPNCTRCAHTILLTTANFRTLFFPNSTTDPPITYTNIHDQKGFFYEITWLAQVIIVCLFQRELSQDEGDNILMTKVHNECYIHV